MKPSMLPKAKLSYRWLFWTLALVGLTADQASKYGVFSWLYDPQRFERPELAPGVVEASVTVIPDVFRLEATYTVETEPGDSPLSWLRTVSAGHLPYVNQG